MKTSFKLIFIAAASLTSATAYAQSAQKWSINGNAVNNGDYIGTTNNQPFLLKANNNEGIHIKPNGDVKISSLNIPLPYYGLVLTNQNGLLSRLDFSGQGSQVLFDNGKWGDLPTASSPWLLNTNKDIYFPSGRVGIGTTTPQLALDVVGDMRVSNSLKVGGNSIIFAGGKGIAYKAASGTQPEVFSYGTLPPGGPDPIFSNIPCMSPLIPTINQFAGLVNAYGLDVNDGSPRVVSMGFDGANGSLDLWGGAPLTPNTPSLNALLIDYYCGSDVFICTGTNHGLVGVGSNFQLGNPARDYNIATNIRSEGRTGIFLDMVSTNANTPQTDMNRWGIKMNIDRPYLKAIEVTNTSIPIGSNCQDIHGGFLVLASGQTFIGGQALTNTVHEDALLQVSGKIAAKEIYVLKPAYWCDHVFNQDYKLLPLSEVEKYYKANKHLPEVPSENEVMEKGVGVAEMDAVLLKKIEELTLYTVALEKKMKELEKKLTERK